jgi:hypothetical protein
VPSYHPAAAHQTPGINGSTNAHNSSGTNRRDRTSTTDPIMSDHDQPRETPSKAEWANWCSSPTRPTWCHLRRCSSREMIPPSCFRSCLSRVLSWCRAAIAVAAAWSCFRSSVFSRSCPPARRSQFPDLQKQRTPRTKHDSSDPLKAVQPTNGIVNSPDFLLLLHPQIDRSRRVKHCVRLLPSHPAFGGRRRCGCA